MTVTDYTTGLASCRIAMLDRDIHYRPGTADEQVINDVFRCFYHRPPESMPVPATVLDCGAHIGLTMLDYRHLWPDAAIFGVEMDAGNLAVAILNTADPVVCGALERSYYGSGALLGCYDPSADTWSYTLGDVGPMSRWVAMVSIPDLIESLGWPYVDFLKLDIEGAELSVIRNPDDLLLVNAVLVECHGDYSKGQARRDLYAAGFTYCTPMGHPSAVFASREP